MTDTETRLRDYLHSKAATIPDEPPPLVLPAKRHWPVVLAAAAIAAVLVIAIPVAIHLTGTDKTEKPATPATSAPPTTRPSNELKIPYLLYSAKTSTLHDGARTVPVGSSPLPPSSRVNGGWIVYIGANRIGVLHPDGRTLPIGPSNTSYPVASPDGSKIALAHPLGKGRTSVLVFDVATRKQIAAVTLPHTTTVLWAWNQAGIWLGEDYKVGAQPLVWKPGEAQPVQLNIPGFDLGLVGAPNTDKVLVVTRTNQGKSWCAKVGSLQGTGLAVDGQYCGTGGRSVSPALSPDGKTVAVIDKGVAVDITTGKVTTLRMPYPVMPIPAAIFEDDTHFVFLPLADPTRPDAHPSGERLGLGRQVYRCDVISGDCTRILKTPTGLKAELIKP